MIRKFISGVLLLCTIVLGAWWFVNRTTGVLFTDDANGPLQREPAWQFVVISDVEGEIDIARRLVDDMAQRNITVVVNVGDIGGAQDKEKIQPVMDLFATLPVPTHFVLGSDELVYNKALERKTRDVFHEVVNELDYYSFNVQNAHFVILDNAYRRDGFPDEELEWLTDDLDANTQPYTFLFFHRPLDVPGQQWFGDDETPHSREQNEKFKALVAQYPITRIFNGHVHTYLGYTLNDIPVTITGGGGATPQALLGGKDAAYYHYVLVSIYNDGSEPTVEVIPLQ